MPNQTCNGATLMCTFGLGPSTLVVLPVNRVLAQNQPAANIMDHVPMVNIPPFPMCASPANPTVIAATAAKLGVFSPSACVPATPAPWVPGAPTVMIGGMPALDNTSTCMCIWGGVISIVNPVALTVMEP